MPTLDLYLILTPLFAILVILGLISFKISLKDEPVIDHKSIEKVREK